MNQSNRIEDFDKNLPIVEIYTAVQSKVLEQDILQWLLEQQDVLIAVILEKVDGVTVGTHPYTQKKEYLHFKLL